MNSENNEDSSIAKSDTIALETRIKTLEQANKKLQGELQQVKKEQVEYLQNVSHQLVAPLNAIKWHIENLTHARIGVTRAQKVLKSVYSQATIAVHLAKNFALMSNLEADHTLVSMQEPLEPIDLCRLMVNIANDFQPLAWDKDIQITVIDDPLNKAPSVLAIKNLISQVFSNILENAVKYSKPSSTIFIDGLHNKTEQTVSVCISNRGLILHTGEENLIFNRGYRSEEAKNLYPAGTGFGLYIARKIADVHQGTIVAGMTEDNSCEFTVTLHISKLEGQAKKRGPKDGINR